MGTTNAKLPESKCAKCGYKMDGATNVHDQNLRPKAGDVSLCLHCGAIGIFDVAQKVRQPSELELVRIMREPGVAEEIARIEAARKKLGMRRAPACH